MAGFIQRYSPVDSPPHTRLIKYRLHDEYLHFYARLIYPRLRQISQGRYTITGSLLAHPFAQWRGYAFERLVRNNYQRMAEVLGFSGIQYRAGSWFRRGHPSGPGAQIDLLYIRADGVLTICEAKYTRKVQARAIEQSMDQKLTALEAAFPRHGVQRILVVASSASLTTQVKAVVDEALVASEDFRRV